MDCSDNQLTDLTVISNDSSFFQKIICSGNLFTELDLSDSDVIALECSNNPMLESINWRNGRNYEFDPDHNENGFLNLPNLNSVCYGPGFNPELQDFILADVKHPVDFYNNETCDALSVNENNLNVLSVTPNPAENSIKIITGTPIKQVEVFNELGQMVLSNKPNTRMDKTMLDISILSKGFYFIKIYDVSGNSTVKKIIKK